jgi:hypothetical protein
MAKDPRNIGGNDDKRVSAGIKKLQKRADEQILKLFKLGTKSA